jgi:hypothetical protein
MISIQCKPSRSEDCHDNSLNWSVVKTIVKLFIIMKIKLYFEVL